MEPPESDHAHDTTPSDDDDRMARILAQAGVRAVDDAGAAASAARQDDAAAYHLWPCNFCVWKLWLDVQTQWRSGMAGRTGLDYAGVRVVVDRRMPRRQRGEAFDALCSMERAALRAWGEQLERGR